MHPKTPVNVICKNEESPGFSLPQAIQNQEYPEI